MARSWYGTLLVLLSVLAALTLADRAWLTLDQSLPAWDEAYHLNNTLTYRDFLARGLALFSDDWWAELWRNTTKNPPLSYLAGAATMLALGPDADTAAWVFLGFNAVLIGSVWVIGTRLWGTAAGLWAAATVALVPGLRGLRLTYLIDLQLVTLVTAAFAALTIWHTSRRPRTTWAAAVGFGVLLGLAMLAKPTAALYLGPPALLALALGMRRAAWRKGLQAVTVVALAATVAWHWYATNLIFIVSAARLAVVSAARIEGDPLPDTLAGWLYYPATLPAEFGWPLLALAAAGCVVLWRDRTARPELLWIGGFALACYVLVTLIPNKDARYVTPYLPALAVIAGAGAARLPRAIPIVALGLAAMSYGAGMFAGPGTTPAQVAAILAPGSAQPPDRQGGWPNRAVLDRIGQVAPYTIETLGLLSAEPAVNAHTMGYLGRLRSPRIYASELSGNAERLAYQIAGLDWILVNTADTRVRAGAWADAAARLAAGPDFSLQGQWGLPRGGELLLYQRSTPFDEVAAQVVASDLRVTGFSFPAEVRPGSVVPLDYRIEGPRQQLSRAMLLIDWQPVAPGSAGWRHDFAPAGGRLHFTDAPPTALQVAGRRAMRVGTDPGLYRAGARLLDLETGRTEALPLPETLLRVAADAPSLPVAPPDPGTRFVAWAEMLREGPPAFDRLFREVGDTNLARPRQAYIDQAGAAASHRLADRPDDIALRYEGLLAAVLRRDAEAALAAIEPIIAAEPDPALAHAYRAFVHLYRRDPAPAREDIARARALGLDLPELVYLEAAALVLQGRLRAAWRSTLPLR